MRKPARAVSWLVVVGLSMTSACRTASNDDAPTLAVLNATIWTGDPEHPLAEALLVSGERIVTVGTSADVRSQVGDATVIDATGRFIVPGFIDAHSHFLDGGFRLASVQLRDADSPAELSRRIGEFAATVPPGTWITGGDWDHQRWGGELPHREMIDEASPDHPVWVHRLDGHMALANSKALEAAGITRETEEVPGGTIERDISGEPTGVLKDNAMELVASVVPAPTDDDFDRALDQAMAHVATVGITSVHHMGSWAELDVLRRAQARDALRTRVRAAVPLSEWSRLADLVETSGTGDHWLSWGVLKGFVDGSLGSHTALFHAPFDDQPEDRGLLITSEDDLQDWIRSADAAGLQLAVHAIGDRANQLLLDIFERVASEHGERDRRFRIEHAQHLRREDVARFSRLATIASMQPYHAIDDGQWAERYIGPVRVRTTYAFKSLLDESARLVFGSDWTVAPASPIEGIYAAVTRRTLDGTNPEGWVPAEKITVEQALEAYTRNAAFASFDEGDRGMLREGFLADFVILDRDLTAVPPTGIRDVRVEATFVGGEAVYSTQEKLAR